MKQKQYGTNQPYGRNVSHGQKAVDPLKRDEWTEKLFSIMGLPRSEGRGPIEAVKNDGITPGSVSVSHGQKAVDPLKRIFTFSVAVLDRESPTVRRPWTH